MTSVFDKLGLRPQERRLVMVTVIVIFAVLNFWLVFPHFGEWKELRARLTAAQDTAAKYQAEIAKIPQYDTKLKTLQSEGSFVLQDEQSLALVQTIQTEAAAAQVFIQRVTPAGGGPIPNNPFFEEQRVTISATADDAQLVAFLKNLGSGNSLIRVRDMDLKPDQGQHQLMAGLTIVGNYQKKPTARATNAPPTTAAGGASKAGPGSARTTGVQTNRP